MKNEVYYLSLIADILDRRLENIEKALKECRYRAGNMDIDREAEYAKGVGQGGLEILEEKGKTEDSES